MIPTFAECAAKPASERNALERFIHAWTPDDVGYEYPGFEWHDQLTAVIEAERAQVEALTAERDQLRDCLKTHPCSHPMQPHSDGYYYTTVADCIAAGNCGCDARAALAPKEPT